MAAICEAVERLLEGGHRPAQDVWLSFGCDEEVSGTAAEAAVDELVRRGVRPWLVLDEGGAVAHEAFPGVKRPVAAIGVAEKGTTSVELRVEGRGGHASTPARNGPTARLARAILAHRPLADAGPAPGHHRRADAPARAAPAAPAAAADGPRRPDPAAAHPRAARRRPRGRGDGAHDVRDHHASTAARRST